MNTVPRFSQKEFDLLLQDHQQMVGSMNDLEYRLYQLGESPAGSPTAECQIAAGVLIGQLRKLLFKWDQEILPTLEVLTVDDPALPEQ